MFLIVGGCGSPAFVRVSGPDGGPIAVDASPTAPTGGRGGGAHAGSGGHQGGVAEIDGGTSTGGFSTGGAAGSGGQVQPRGTGGGAVAIGSGGAGTGGAGTGGAGTGGIMTGPGRYDFESSLQSWSAAPGTSAFETLTVSTAQSFGGASALAATIAATGTTLYRLVVTPRPGVPVGATLTFHVFFPARSAIDWIQPYALGIEPQSAWTGTGVPTNGLMPAAWNTMTITVPATAEPIRAIGVEFHIAAAWTGVVYVDDVSW